jgi:hypothetical protein
LNSTEFGVYEGWLRDYYSQPSVVRPIARRVVFVIGGWGEIVLNLPYSRFRAFGPGFVAAGIISLVTLAIALRKLPGPLNPARLYLLTYALIVAVWPNPTPRLWMPIVPLLIAEIGLLISRFPPVRWKSRLIGVYAVWFAATGIAALAYTSRISFSGQNFAKVYGRKGGMPTIEVDESDLDFEHIQGYKAEAKRMADRYGGLGVGRK